MNRISRTLILIFFSFCFSLHAQTLDNRADIGPFNARQRSIALQIDYTNHNRWYLGTEGGGLWISTDAGKKWAKLDATNKLGSKPIDIAQDYDDPNIILYASPKASNSLDYDFPNPGLFRSTDNGVSFTKITDPSNSVINSFTPYDLQIVNSKIFMQTNSGIYKIANNGTATEVYNSASESVTRMEVLKENNTTEHILFTQDNNAIYKGTDGGTFTPVLNIPNASGIDIGFSRSNPSIVYVAVAIGGDTVKQIHKSTDYGATWTTIYNRTNSQEFCNQGDIWFGYYDFNGLWVDDIDPNKLIITSTDMAYSNDGGLNWFFMKNEDDMDERTGVGDYWPQSFQRNPANGKIIIGCDHGLAEGNDSGFFDLTGSTPPKVTKYGTDWVEKSLGVNAFTGYVGTYLGNSGNDFVIAGQDRGAWISTAGTLKYAGGADVYNLLITDNYVHTFNKHGSNLIETYSRSGVYNSALAFNNTNVETYNTGNQASQAANVVYYANDFPHEATHKHFLIKAVAPNYNTASIVYQSNTEIKSVTTHPTSGNTYILEGETIKRINNASGVATTLVTGATDVTEIELQMDNENMAYGFSENGDLFKFDLTNGTKTNIAGAKNFNPPHGEIIRNYAFEALHDKLLYLGTNYGVFSSIDKGKTWQKEAAFPDVMVFDIDIRPTDHKVFFFTYGMGAITMTIKPNFLGVKAYKDIENKNNFNFTLFPNPTAQSLTVKSEDWSGDKVHVSIFTLEGKMVLECIKDRKSFQNNTSFSVDVSKLQSGHYLLQVKDEKSALVKLFAVQ